MKRLLSLLFCCASSFTSLAQRVLYTSQDVNKPYAGPPIRTIRPHWPFSSTLTIVYADGQKQKVSRDSLWGYEDRRNRVYRYAGHTFYRVTRIDSLVNYRHSGGRYTTSHFSKTLDSPIRATKRKDRKDAPSGR